MRDNERTKWNGKREEFLDILRVAAACAVVLMHTVTGVMTAGYDFRGWERRVRAFQALVDMTAWCVPVFLMISGYLFLDPKRQISMREMLTKYCRRVFLALVVFGIPYSFLELYAAERVFRPIMLWEALRNTATGHSWAHMWYLYLILILYALTPLLKWGLKKMPDSVLYAVTALLFLCSSLVPFWINLKTEFGLPMIQGAGIYLFYYLCGYLFAKQKKKPSSGVSKACLAVFALLTAGQSAARFLGAEFTDMAYSYPVTVAQAVLLFSGMRVRPGAGSESREKVLAFAQRRGGRRRIWRTLEELSFGVYLIHPVFLNFFYKFLKISVMDFRFWIGVPLFFCIALFGAAAVTVLLRKIPLLRKYVL